MAPSHSLSVVEWLLSCLFGQTGTLLRVCSIYLLAPMLSQSLVQTAVHKQILPFYRAMDRVFLFLEIRYLINPVPCQLGRLI